MLSWLLLLCGVALHLLPRGYLNEVREVVSLLPRGMLLLIPALPKIYPRTDSHPHTHTPTTSLQRALALAGLRRHRDVLRLYALQLGDLALAEKYCGSVSDDDFLHILQICESCDSSEIALSLALIGSSPSSFSSPSSVLTSRCCRCTARSWRAQATSRRCCTPRQ
jgi:hypothetical protein